MLFTVFFMYCFKCTFTNIIAELKKKGIHDMLFHKKEGYLMDMKEQMERSRKETLGAIEKLCLLNNNRMTHEGLSSLVLTIMKKMRKKTILPMLTICGKMKNIRVGQCRAARRSFAAAKKNLKIGQNKIPALCFCA